MIPIESATIAAQTPPLVYDPAPDLCARTTMGERRPADYRGRWLLFFSHPVDSTPVCTSEFIALAAARFLAVECEPLALSVDSLFSHLAWLPSIRGDFGVEMTFPIVEDPSRVIARACGMTHAKAANASAVRAVFVTDPDGIVRSILWHSMTTGRSVDELLALVAALQASDEQGANTPEGWRPGDEVILPPPLTFSGIAETPSPASKGWYFQTGPLPVTSGATE